MKVLVTGGSGLVGRYIVDALLHVHTVDVLDLQRPHREDVDYHQVDVLHLDHVTQALKSCEAVVHLAGIPHPLNEPAEKVFRVNTMGTWNVLEACTRTDVRKLVFLSSESTLGIAFSSRRIWPHYLSIDEDHPTIPQDPYGMSKLTAELLCRGYSARTDLQTICLRPPWIWVPEEKETLFYRQLIKEYSQWPKNLWAYIHVRDVAEAVLLALGADQLPPHDVFFICADENWTGHDSRKLAATYFPETKEFRNGFKKQASFISSAKAKRLLGFHPKHTWREFASPD